MDRSVAEAIRQQSEDLRDELKELEQWEDAVQAREAAKAQRKVPPSVTTASAADTIEPPIRGTVPSLKEALRQQQKSVPSDNGAGVAVTDPIQHAKEKGNAFFQSGHLQEALAAYSKGIDLDPASSTTHVLYANRSMCHLKLSQWAAAEKDATTCIHMNTGYAKAYYRRAIARKNLGKLREARADLEAVLALAPKDASAQQEMEAVTKALQAERAAATAAFGATKKRIIIEEVESEDDNEDDAVTPSPAVETKLSAEEVQKRQERIAEDMRVLASAREERETQTRLQAERDAEAQAKRQRCHQRVEIIEDEEVKATSAETVHSISSPKLPVSPSTPAPSASPTTAPRARPALTKEDITAPKSFTEFERRFRDVAGCPELRNYYVRQLNPPDMPKLFGSNMNPEMLHGILQAIHTFDADIALQYAKGLCQVRRVEDLTLFFNSEEKAVVQGVLDHLRSANISSKDIALIERKLKPL